MLPYSRSSLRSPTSTLKLSTFFCPLFNPISYLSQNPTSKMLSHPNSKRPTCPNCSKPLALCLCARFRTPCIDNKVHITILQHSLETKHPLNSARIAKLGLKNVHLFTVSDVLLDTQFVIRSLGSGEECTSGVCRNGSESLDSSDCFEVKRTRTRTRGFDLANELDSEAVSNASSGSERLSDCTQLGDSEFGGLIKEEERFLLKKSNENVEKCNVEPVIKMTVGKYGEIKSIYHPWMLVQDEGKILKYEHVIASPEAARFLERGYVVKKLRNQQKEGSIEMRQLEEFEIEVPPGSVLLFPAQDSVPIEAVDFEVKNLIVLDGTWAKANRMHKENPWLKVLPCVKLDMEKISLFSEVRRQPKPGCLSTIESIVYALKALGDRDNLEGLFSLLDVFESMVEDQRRCKDERIRKQSSA